MPRDGRYLELLGTLDPRTDPTTVTLRKDRAEYWLSVGARPSHTVKTVLAREMPGHFESLLEKQKARIVAQRKARKVRAGNRAKAAKK